MRHVILPQAFRAVVPPLASVLIALVKNTSVAAAFGLLEATARMRFFTNDNADVRPEIFLIFAIGYIIIVEIISAGAWTPRASLEGGRAMTSVLFDAPGPEDPGAPPDLHGGDPRRCCSASSGSWSPAWCEYDQFAYEKWEPFLTPDYIEAILVDGVARDPEDGGRSRSSSPSSSALVFGVGKMSDHAWVRWPAGWSWSSSAPSRCCC